MTNEKRKLQRRRAFVRCSALFVSTIWLAYIACSDLFQQPVDRTVNILMPAGQGSFHIVTFQISQDPDLDVGESHWECEAPNAFHVHVSTGEALSADPSASAEFIQKLQSLVITTSDLCSASTDAKKVLNFL